MDEDGWMEMDRWRWMDRDGWMDGDGLMDGWRWDGLRWREMAIYEDGCNWR